MADELEPLVQNIVIRFEMDPAAIQAQSDAVRAATERMEQAAVEGQSRITQAVKAHMAEQTETVRRELADTQAEFTKHYGPDLEKLNQKILATEILLGEMTNVFRNARTNQLEISAAATEAERQQFQTSLAAREQYERQRADLISRGMMKIAPTLGLTDEEKAEQRSRRRRGMARQVAGGLFPIPTDVLRQSGGGEAVNLLGGIVNGILSIRSPLDAILVGVNAIKDVAMLGYRERLRTAQQQLGMAGGTVQFARYATGSGGSTMEGAAAVQAEIERTGLLTKEEILKVPGQLKTMFHGMNSSLNLASEEMVGHFYRTRMAAYEMGMSFEEVADLATKQARRERISLPQSINMMQQLNYVGTRLSEAFRDIRATDYVKWTLTAQDKLYRFGIGLDETRATVAKFSKELDTGVISLDELIQFMKGTQKMDPGMYAFMAERLVTEGGVIGKALSQVRGSDLRGVVLQSLSGGGQELETYRDLGLLDRFKGIQDPEERRQREVGFAETFGQKVRQSLLGQVRELSDEIGGEGQTKIEQWARLRQVTKQLPGLGDLGQELSGDAFRKAIQGTTLRETGAAARAGGVNVIMDLSSTHRSLLITQNNFAQAQKSLQEHMVTLLRRQVGVGTRAEAHLKAILDYRGKIPGVTPNQPIWGGLTASHAHPEEVAKTTRQLNEAIEKAGDVMRLFNVPERFIPKGQLGPSAEAVERARAVRMKVDHEVSGEARVKMIHSAEGIFNTQEIIDKLDAATGSIARQAIRDSLTHAQKQILLSTDEGRRAWNAGLNDPIAREAPPKTGFIGRR